MDVVQREAGQLMGAWAGGTGEWFEWEELTDDLTELIAERNPDGRWYAEVSNFGWRSLNGWSEFRAVEGEEFLQAVLPDTPCNFKVFAWGEDGFAIQNYHHDSPVGREWYYIRPIEPCTYCGEDLVRSGRKWPVTYQDDPFCCWNCVAEQIHINMN